jgi:hypothetical protein
MSRPSSLSGEALRTAFGVLEAAARWTTAIPNDTDSVVEVGRQAQHALSLAEQQTLARKPLRLAGSRDELNARRYAYGRALFAAQREAEIEYGIWWNTYPGTLWIVRVDREIARYVNRDFKASYDAIERPAPAPRYWATPPEGVEFLYERPCLYKNRPKHHAPGWAEKSRPVAFWKTLEQRIGKANTPEEREAIRDETSQAATPAA